MRCFLLLALVSPLAVQAAAPPPLAVRDRYGDPLPLGAVSRIGSTRWRHPGGIIDALAYSPDGRRLATVGIGDACIWEQATGRLLHRLPTAFDASASVITPDSKQLVLCAPGKVALFDLATGRAVRTFKVGDDEFQHAAISPDGKMLALGGESQSYLVISLQTGKKIGRRPWKGQCFNNMAWVPGTGELAMLRLTDENLYLVTFWNPRTDQTRLVSFKDGSGPCVNCTACFAFSLDGKSMAVAEHSGKIRLRDARTGKILDLFGKIDGWIIGLRFSPDGRSLASSSASGPIVLWNVKARKRIARLPFDHLGLSGVAFSPDSKTLATADREGKIRFWDAATGKARKESPPNPPSAGSPFAYAPENGELLAMSDEGVRAWNVATGKQVRRPLPCGLFASAALAADGKILAVAHSDQSVELLDRASGEGLASFAASRTPATFLQPPPTLAMSRDGKTLAVTTLFGELSLYDIASLKPQKLPAGKIPPVYAMALSPDGKTLAGSSKHGGVVVWDLPSGKAARRLANSELVRALAFSPDGRTLASLNPEGVRLWDMRAWKRRADIALKGKDELNTLAFSPSGDMLAASGKALLLLDPRKARPLVRLLETSGEISAPVFSRDGKRIATGSSDGTILIWDAARFRPARR